jgi:hypothetical protein
MRIRFSRKLRVVCALVWVLFVLYPNPLTLVRSIDHVSDPQVDPEAARAAAAKLPDDPRRIERAVLDDLVPYSYDWQTDGVPWYFPTVGEALRDGRGDCESRALVLASILDAKGIPYELRMSFDHIWVDYPGKRANDIENDAVVLADDDGWRWPERFDIVDEARNQVAFYWTPMPASRKVLLLGGLAVLTFWGLGRRLLSVAASRRATAAAADVQDCASVAPPRAPVTPPPVTPPPVTTEPAGD